MKLEEFIRLKQGGDPVMQYLNKFNHLSQYAIDQVNTDLKKKNCVVEPPELFQLKCLSHASGAITHLNRNNPSVAHI
jgi:hypothetical protein